MVYLYKFFFKVLIALAEYGYVIFKVRKIQIKISDKFSCKEGHEIANRMDGLFLKLSVIINGIFISIFFPVSFLYGIKNGEI